MDGNKFLHVNCRIVDGHAWHVLLQGWAWGRTKEIFLLGLVLCMLIDYLQLTQKCLLPIWSHRGGTCIKSMSWIWISEDELMKRYLEKSDDLRSLQQNNHQLNMGFMKMKAMNGWKQQHFQVKFLKRVCLFYTYNFFSICHMRTWIITSVLLLVVLFFVMNELIWMKFCNLIIQDIFMGDTLTKTKNYCI